MYLTTIRTTGLPIHYMWISIW